MNRVVFFTPVTSCIRVKKSRFITGRGTSYRMCAFFPGDHHFLGAQVSVLDRGISILFSPEMTVNNLEDGPGWRWQNTTEKNLTSIPLEKIRSPQFWETEFLSEFHTRNFRVFYIFYHPPPLNHKKKNSGHPLTKQGVLKCGWVWHPYPSTPSPKLDMWKPERR